MPRPEIADKALEVGGEEGPLHGLVILGNAGGQVGLGVVHHFQDFVPRGGEAREGGREGGKEGREVSGGFGGVLGDAGGEICLGAVHHFQDSVPRGGEAREGA